jgi:hypothetical protein
MKLDEALKLIEQQKAAEEARLAELKNRKRDPQDITEEALKDIQRQKAAQEAKLAAIKNGKPSTNNDTGHSARELTREFSRSAADINNKSHEQESPPQIRRTNFQVREGPSR